jgi:hypothetical protein
MLNFFKVKNPYNKRFLRVLVFIKICIFKFYFAYGWKIELIHGGHEILILVSAAAACRVGKLNYLKNWPIETLGAIVTLWFAYPVVKGILDIRGVRGHIRRE